ncbi:FHA domain-containing protein [Bifidobacterium sp. ESL0745]|uniref:FHA domain-containing protein n=1 Tax=Bifidobacterium sp. ESL0745 TaxID=2983226 RepID=UPI0032AF8FF4
MSALPFPPPPEFGWCDDDVADAYTSERVTVRSVQGQFEPTAPTAQGQLSQGSSDQAQFGESTQYRSFDREPDTEFLQGQEQPAESVYGSVSTQPPQTLESEVVAVRQKSASDGPQTLSVPTINSNGGIKDWDGTVLSASFMSQKPQKRYRLHNDVTGQDILLDKSALLGRHVSATVPQGAMSVKIADPTRTVSRNHAALSYDKDGALWVEDYGSLNGTYIIDGNREQQVKGSPVRLTAPMVLRFGDQFFRLTEDKD